MEDRDFTPADLAHPPLTPCQYDTVGACKLALRVS